MRAWTFQDHRQKKKLGDKAPWSVGWLDPEGKPRATIWAGESTLERIWHVGKGGQAAHGTRRVTERRGISHNTRRGDYLLPRSLSAPVQDGTLLGKIRLRLKTSAATR